MIIVRANARNATYISDDLITSGSVGIPVTFNLSEDFDDLSAIAVFEGSGTARDVALIGDSCVVPHEVLATAGGYLRIGIYASNGEGTIVIPTVWAGSKMILRGTTPSEVDPSEPTPSWVAQVQEAAAEALETANNVLDMTVEAETLASGSEATVEKSIDPDTGAITLEFGIPRGDTGPDGDDGFSPTVTVTDITGGHRVTITDATGQHSFDVMDGDAADAPVQSVNGQTGAVMLDAADVGAGTYSKPSGGIPASDLAAGVIPTVPVQDVQVNGTSILSDGVANVPVADGSTLGVLRVSSSFGHSIDRNLRLIHKPASTDTVKKGTDANDPIVPKNQHESTFYGLAQAAGDTTQSQSSNAVGNYTDSAKSAISQMLNGSVSVTGTTPTITALPGIRYVCGEVATLDITLPASGIVDVMFESGATPTVLTITPPTGVTLKWANGFDPTSLDANTTYEINIADGLGVAASWT